MNSTYEKLILSEFLTQKKPQTPNRSLISKTRNTTSLPVFQHISPANKLTFGVYAPPPKTPQSNIRKPKKQEIEQPITLFKDLQYKNLYEGEFRAAGERPREHQIQVIIKLFHFYAPLNQLRRVTSEDIFFFKKQFKTDLQKPKMMRNESIVRAPNELRNAMTRKAFQSKANMSILGNQDDLYHLIYLKWIKKIASHNDAALVLIRQAIVTAIFAVRQWDPCRERKLKKQVVEWKFELSD